MIIDFNFSLMTVSIIIWFFICLYLRKRKQRGYSYLLFFTIFYCYIAYVFAKTQFPIFLTGFNINKLPEVLASNVKLLPHKASDFQWISNDMILNIILTVPFGFGINFVKSLRLRKTLLYGLFFSLSIECLQLFILFISRYLWRIVDINDIILNLAGVALGYGCFVLFSRFFVSIVERSSIKLDPVSSYIYRTAITALRRN